MGWLSLTIRRAVSRDVLVVAHVFRYQHFHRIILLPRVLRLS